MEKDLKSEKLQKVLANKGVGSRREVENWITSKRVRVNGKIAKIGDRVLPSDKIKIDGRSQNQKYRQHRHLLYNKPIGEICSRKDNQGRPSVYDVLPRLTGQRWISVGRLDINTSGLLLFTTDGELANRLMHPSFEIEREYAVRVLGNVKTSSLEKMKEGVYVDGHRLRFSDIQKSLSSPEKEKANSWYYVVLMEGKNKEVRKIWESQGYTVSRLKRVRYGTFFVPSSVKAGRYVEFDKSEVRSLYRLAGLDKNS